MLDRAGASDDDDLAARFENVIEQELRVHGAHFDIIGTCSDAPGNEQKSQADVIAAIKADWPLDVDASLFVSTKPLDQSAQAGITGHHFAGGSLFDFIAPLLR
jgi:hypothetical protein